MRGLSIRSVRLCALFAAAVVVAAAAPAAATVLIVRSDDLPQYSDPIAAFRDAIGEPTQILDISGPREEAEARVREATARTAPSGVYALGARAAVLSRSLLPATPMVFSMVVGWNRYALEEGPVTGVSVEIPVDALFTRFKLLLPRLARIGLISSRETDPHLIAAARAAALDLNLTLVEESVAGADEVAGAYRRMRAEIDALWMVPDPLVVTRENFAYLAQRARHDGVAFLGFSENFVRAGALLSVAPSYATMGSQAAALLARLLVSPTTPPGVQPPVGSQLVVNADTARRLGLNLDATAIGMADLVIDLASARR